MRILFDKTRQRFRRTQCAPEGWESPWGDSNQSHPLRQKSERPLYGAFLYLAESGCGWEPRSTNAAAQRHRNYVKSRFRRFADSVAHKPPCATVSRVG